MSLSDLLPAIRPVLSESDRLGIVYYIGGSVASSIYGEPRSTLDIDIGAELSEPFIGKLVALWAGDFYVSEIAMRDAVQRGKCFHLIHLKTFLKVDIFVSGADAFNASTLKRRRPQTVQIGSESLSVWIATPEDVVLHKLLWYRKGNETSERQSRDIAGILKQQQDRLDKVYLEEWADTLNVRDLWNRICEESAMG